MKLYQVRKGQFVFFQNELHKVYAVRPVYKKPVLLYRLKDMQRIQAKPGEIESIRPQNNDTFIFYGKRYTIENQKEPEEGDYILIHRPAPDLLDHYSLNEIEKVGYVEEGNVLTTRDNGVKRKEYVVMTPGRSEGAREIAYQDASIVSESQMADDESIAYLIESDESLKPLVGDIYIDVHQQTKAMIVAMTEDEVIFGHGVRVHVAELLDKNNFELVYQVDEGL
ncbi:hypothetical protein ACFOGI_07720 [Virgibacillus xinjiangensis]|uniref:Uncharacterized protein n=1 Tax=Virgibacillus xinjiangensis TaxID=393090 RepID=A0ABV7CV14_9BACI